jgi:hypothetical protein
MAKSILNTEFEGCFTIALIGVIGATAGSAAWHWQPIVSLIIFGIAGFLIWICLGEK